MSLQKTIQDAALDKYGVLNFDEIRTRNALGLRC
jgi:hypothetical protein